MSLSKLFCPLVVALVFAAAKVGAQEPSLPPSRADRPISLGELTPTPEMWFYEQALRQYHDPRYAVRMKAEYCAAQRQHRIAAQKWFGYSAARPTVSPDPMYGSFSPHWGGNSSDSWLWRGYGATTVVRYPDNGSANMR